MFPPLSPLHASPHPYVCAAYVMCLMCSAERGKHYEIIFFFKPKRKLRPHFPFLQAMLREFEDQENLLAEMDEQVDAYRAAGKQEAALRYGQSL